MSHSHTKRALNVHTHHTYTHIDIPPLSYEQVRAAGVRHKVCSPQNIWHFPQLMCSAMRMRALVLEKVFRKRTNCAPNAHMSTCRGVCVCAAYFVTRLGNRRILVFSVPCPCESQFTLFFLLLFENQFGSVCVSLSFASLSLLLPLQRMRACVCTRACLHVHNFRPFAQTICSSRRFGRALFC